VRHNKKFNHPSRKSAHREAMLANMTISLIMHKRIVTTLAKAKALRMYAEPIINRAKDDTTASRRIVFKSLQNKEAVKELYSTVAAKIADRPGGYTRILKLGNRLGDNAKTCFIELVDFNEAMLEAKNQEKAAAKKSTRRSRKKAAAPAAEAPAAPAAEEAPKTEE
jgi:large subunit ribosomal protein L17